MRHDNLSLWESDAGMNRVDGEIQRRRAEKLGAGAERTRGRASSRERVERPRKLFDQARAEGRRPGCPESFCHSSFEAGIPPYEGWYLELEGMVSLAITAHRAGVRASDIEDLFRALGSLETNDQERLAALLHSGRAEEAFRWAGMSPEPAGPDVLEAEFPEIAPLAGELGLTWEGFLSFLHAADVHADSVGTACNAAWLVTWAYLFQYDSAQRLFEYAAFKPAPSQLIG